MTIGEANAVSLLARYILGITSVAGTAPPSDEQARDALELLTAKSSKVLMAGVTPEKVREAFEKKNQESNQTLTV